MPLQATSGAASYDAFGGGAAAVPAYIEDVFSTYLYAGNESTQAIPNGIDLSTKGGLVWLKARDIALSNWLFDTQRGSSNRISSNSTSAQASASGWINSFDTNGFTLGSNGNVNGKDAGTSVPYNYASWTFRKQPKFFDVVTWTGNYPTDYPRVISHNLGSTPGCVIIKCTSNVGSWGVWHRSISTGDYNANDTLYLNSTAASVVYGNVAGPFTSTTITVGEDLNQSGRTYVAYLFAHNAGGFGLTGTDNVISCGSFTTSSYAATINLGYEPQWLLVKSTSSSGNWFVIDNMRGLTNGSGANFLFPNLSDAESASGSNAVKLLSTGFSLDVGYSPWNGNATNTYIYIAIRRGPMKVPTDGTKVFNTLAHTGDAGNIQVTGVGFPPDLLVSKWRSGISGTQEAVFLDKLRGTGRALFSDGTGAEYDWVANVGPLGQDGVKTTTAQNAIINKTGDNNAWWFMKRAPSFFDEVCYTGTGSGQVINHNLGVTPELMIFKARNNLNNSGYEYWYTNAPNTTYALALNLNVGESYTKISSANSTTISLGGSNNYVLTGQTYVAYLFATCAGVSKVFSYTGNGSSQTINCGFTAGSRFVLIKRTDSTGDWYVWDSARGIVSGNDPHLSLNSTAAEVTTDDTIDTDSTGFVVNQVSATNVNVSSATYIGIAIA